MKSLPLILLILAGCEVTHQKCSIDSVDGTVYKDTHCHHSKQIYYCKNGVYTNFKRVQCHWVKDEAK
jgi:hypothetical protein